MHRFEAMQLLTQHVGDLPVVANLGPTTDELWNIGDRPRNFYTFGSMGLCSSIALGMALSTTDKILSFDGDGSLLMNLGAIATIGREMPSNLVVVVWDNEEWGQTGHQSSHTAKGTDLEQVARSCSISKTATVDNEEDLVTVFRQALSEEGPWFIVAKVEETDDEATFAPNEPEMFLHRFRQTYL